MFAQLTAYHYLNFARAYPYIYYSTAEQEMTWVIFAAFYTDISFYYNIPIPTTRFTPKLSTVPKRAADIFLVSTSIQAIRFSRFPPAHARMAPATSSALSSWRGLLRPGETPKAVDVTQNPNPRASKAVRKIDGTYFFKE
jgi:sortase B